MSPDQLYVRDGQLCCPDIDDSLLIYRYPSGDVDFIQWPNPDVAKLRAALYDARECGLINDVPQVKLPDGTLFDIEVAPTEVQAKPDDWKGVYPGMCINPEICRGHSYCPRNYSCCE